jgi:hypothetical protein
MLRPKRQRIMIRSFDPDENRERLTLECGHTIIQAPRVHMNKRHSVVCTDCPPG